MVAKNLSETEANCHGGKGLGEAACYPRISEYFAVIH